MSHTVGNALWGKKDGGARPRIALAAAIAVVVALAAPALGRAADVPASLLAQAQANPNQTFDVIVQASDPSENPVQATIDAVSAVPQQSFQDSVQAARDAARKAADLARQAGDAQNRANVAQQRANQASARAAQTGSPSDRAAAAQAQADAATAIAAAQAAQAAAATAQSAAMVAQMAIMQQQANATGAMARAQADIHAQYAIVPAVSATVTGTDIVGMQASDAVESVTPDTPVAITGFGYDDNNNPQKWVESMQAKPFWASMQRRMAAGHTPTIAIVDSGIDSTRRADFGTRVIGQVNLVSSGPNSPGDGRGHGTMVADVAAGSNPLLSGVDPDAPLISLDVIDDNGMGHTSDVIAAADWILANRVKYNIRVANFSLESAQESTFMFDPLDKAVEQLWMNGVTVVAAAGNYAVNGAQSGVHFAPANDPFVITVGAVDIGNDPSYGNYGDDPHTGNDKAAPWSAWGYTNDGFLKPEISAPGRYIIAACSSTDTLCALGGLLPSLLHMGQGYNELSGTSFSAPMVSAAAAAILALHPDWTPDQVKGQLMLTANALKQAAPGSVGVGELDIKDATGQVRSTPPNPNQAIDQFIAQTPAGPVFDVGSWATAAKASAAWNSASWSSASWSSASWSSASWASAAWNSASWASASWTSAAWNSYTNQLALANNASQDTAGDG